MLLRMHICLCITSPLEGSPLDSFGFLLERRGVVAIPVWVVVEHRGSGGTVIGVLMR